MWVASTQVRSACKTHFLRDPGSTPAGADQGTCPRVHPSCLGGIKQATVAKQPGSRLLAHLTLRGWLHGVCRHQDVLLSSCWIDQVGWRKASARGGAGEGGGEGQRQRAAAAGKGRAMRWDITFTITYRVTVHTCMALDIHCAPLFGTIVNTQW